MLSVSELLPLLVVFAFTAAAFAQVAGQAASQPASKSPINIALFGDSIFDGKYLPAEYRLEPVLQAKLRDAYGRRDIIVHTVAHGGDTVERFMRPDFTYENGIKTLPKRVDLVVIMFGGNDEDVFTPEEFLKNLATLCDRTLADFPGANILLCSSPVNKTHIWWAAQPAGAQEPVKRYFDQTASLAAERGYPFSDVYAAGVAHIRSGDWDLGIRSQKLSQQYYGDITIDASRDAERTGDGEAWFSDGHPNVHGMDVIADVILQTIKATWPAEPPKANPVATTQTTTQPSIGSAD